MPKRHLRGFQAKKKNVHACARLDGEMAHTYAHLPPDTAHACARLTLVCAHASNHGSAPPPHLPSGVREANRDSLPYFEGGEHVVRLSVCTACALRA